MIRFNLEIRPLEIGLDMRELGDSHGIDELRFLALPFWVIRKQ